MNNKYPIMFSLSVALAMFYSLPWVALSEQARMAGTLDGDVGVRVAYLFITVLITSIFFFQYNLFWKSRLRILKSTTLRHALNMLINFFMVVVACVIIMIISSRFFDISVGRGYFIFYFFRNAGIDLIVILVTYVLELVAKSRADKIKVLTLQSQNSEAELAALRSQIDPHFLFNSLTSLSGLIRANSREALAFVNHLTETFRYILEKKEHKLVTVEEELHFLQSYVFMMEKRFVDGFHVIIKIKQTLYNRNIPQFALQIALENAIKHNMVSVKNRLTIEIFDSENSIVVRNNLQKKKAISGYGIGLENLSKRYRIISSQNIEIKKSECHFEIHLPLL
jgi:two-component system, LytTR family, sensor kinase